jgi:L-lactate dehydrogenase
MPDLVRLAPDAVFLLVTNPCDVLAYAAVQISGLPANRVFSSGTVLDSSRLRWQLAEKVGVSTESVHAMIVGEHGDSEFPLWSEAKIGPVKLSEWRVGNRVPLNLSELDEIADNVKNAAYKVIAGKGATNYAIGLSAARIVEAILRDESVILPVSSVLTDYLGVSDVALSVPTIVNRQGAFKTIPMEMSANELSKFHESAAALKASIASLGLS